MISRFMKRILPYFFLCIFTISCTPSKKRTTLPETKVKFATADTLLQKLFDKTEAKAKQNIKSFPPYYKVMVEGAEYPYIWVETQPLGGVMYAKRNMQIAYDNVVIFLKYQLPSGRIPGMIIPMDNNVWNIKDVTEVENGALGLFTGTLQGYFIPPAALELGYMLEKDTAYLNLLYKTFEAFDNYLWRTRDSDKDNCLETWCVTDAGEDNLIRYDYAPFFWPFDYPPTPEHIPADSTFLKKYWNAPFYEDLTVDKIPVPIESIDIMSYSYSGRDALAEISALLQNGKESYWREKANEVKQTMFDYLWNHDKNAYYFRDKNNRPIESLTHNNLRAMYFGTMTQEMADNFIRDHLLNPEEFWSPMPLPSIAINDPYFRNIAQNNWSRQPQGLTYQRAIHALENYGHLAEITLIGHKLLKQIGKSGIYTQQFDPFTGEQNGLDGYGPTVLSVLEYISRLYGISFWKDSVNFNGSYAEKPYIYKQQIGDKSYMLSQNKGLLTGSLNGKKLFECTAGVRISIDNKGNVVKVSGIDTLTRNIVLKTGGVEMTSSISPNEQLQIKNNQLMTNRSIPFDYPYKQKSRAKDAL